MSIKETHKTVYLTEDGQEHLTREAAQKHHDKVKRDAIISWLATNLYDVGGPHYEFDADEAADWIIGNIAKINERLNQCN